MLMLGKFRIGLSNLHFSELENKKLTTTQCDFKHITTAQEEREREKLKQEHAICRMIIKQCSNPV